MLGLLDPDQVHANVGLFVEFANPGAAPPEDLRAAYFAGLNQLQRHGFRAPADAAGPVFEFDALHPENLGAVRNFLKCDVVSEECLFSESEQAVIRENGAAAFELLRRYDERAVETIELVVACFLCAKKSGAGGGSFGDSLGVVWFDPNPEWSHVDYAETILHEAVHQSVFLSDMVRRLFVRDPREMTAEEALVRSAILESRRPYDLAFHSACVGAALADFFAGIGIPERSASFVERLRPTVAGLRDKSGYLTEAGLAILGQLERYVAERRAGPPSGR